MKPTILVFTRYYLPGHRGGGPVRSIANLVDRLGDSFDFRIVTSDRDVGSNSAYDTVQAGVWNQVGRASVFYTDGKSQSISGFNYLLENTEHDAIYLNSFFDPTFTMLPLFAARYRKASRAGVIIAPRGEFAEGALRIKPAKKKAFLFIAALSGLHKNVIWQASTQAEVADITHRAPAAGEVVEAVDLLPAVAERGNSEAMPRSPGKPLRICFLSRIAPMKNLAYAIDVLGKVQADVVFHIFGPREDADYWKECETRIGNLPGNVGVEAHGELEHSRVAEVMAQHDLFFLPTRGENFGHVIAEALGAGLPVLTSDRTPWQVLKERGAGWTLPLDDPQGFANTIDSVAAWDGNTARQASTNAQTLAIECSADTSAVDANRRLLQAACAKKG